MKWLKESNRMKHFTAGLLIAIVFTLLGSVIAGLYKENQDAKYRGAFDKLDVWATVLGGGVGQIIQVGLFFLALKMGLLWFLVFITINPLFVIAWIYAFEGKEGLKKLFKSIKSIFI